MSKNRAPRKTYNTEFKTEVQTHLAFLDIHRNLERKVTERTAQLKQKNQQILDTQQQLIHAEKMAALGTLTAGVVHEVNNPINFVKVSNFNVETDLQRLHQFLLELVGDDEGDTLQLAFKERFERLDKHLSANRNGVERIASIVQDLRTFTQFDAASQKVANIVQLLQTTISLVLPSYVEHIEVVKTLNEVPHIQCYPAQLNQVFMHLLTNACDAIVSRQRTVAGKGMVWVDCAQQNHCLKISIKDNGTGIDSDIEEKIFEPLFTTKEVGEGCGLGLSVCWGIIERHGGIIELHSIPGKGAQFIVILPLSVG